MTTCKILGFRIKTFNKNIHMTFCQYDGNKDIKGIVD